MSSMPSGVKVYGMEVSRLQSNVTIDGKHVLHGNLHHVKDFDGYAKGASGHFVAMAVDAPAEDEVTYKSEAVPNGKLEPEDRTLVWRVEDTSKTLSVTVKHDGESTTTEYRASGLTLEADPAAAAAAAIKAKPTMVATAGAGTLDRAQLEAMGYNELKKLAADIDAKPASQKKGDLIDAIAAIPATPGPAVEPPTEDDDVLPDLHVEAPVTE